MRTPGFLVLLLAATLMLGCDRTSGPAEASESLRIDMTPVEIAPAKLDGLELIEAVKLTADHPNFGGLSGLLIEDGQLTAVTDAGWLLTADFPIEAGFGAATFRPLPGASGSGDKTTSDSESVARLGEGLAIGFERDHRIEIVENGRITRVIRDHRLDDLPGNGGIEALATLPNGDLLAIGEVAMNGSFPVFVIRPDGGLTEGTLPKIERHEVTSADIGPDGRLYLLRRDWSIFAGVSIRIERYGLDSSGFPVPESREVLAAFESASGIDNMEGIAAWTAPEGGTRLAIISDDNFNTLQRTLLLMFQVVE